MLEKTNSDTDDSCFRLGGWFHGLIWTQTVTRLRFQDGLNRGPKYTFSLANFDIVKAISTTAHPSMRNTVTSLKQNIPEILIWLQVKNTKNMSQLDWTNPVVR